jgi:hypothetical protein
LKNGVFGRASKETGEESKEESEEEGASQTPYQPSFLDPWLTDHFVEMLAGLNLEDLCEQARRSGLPSDSSLVEMYHI